MEVRVMVGVPGSGKTSMVKNSMMQIGGLHLSSDKIREDLDTEDNAEVFKVMNEKLREAIKGNLADVIFYDATNINRKRRRGLYRNIKSWDNTVDVSIRFISIPFELALKNNNKRTGKALVPEEVILRMHRQLQVPRIGVDCDNFYVVGVPMFNSPKLESTQDLVDNVNPLWESEIKLTDTEHDCPPWHLEDVFTHIDMAVDNAKGPTMKTIALFHDLGKGITKIKGKDGFATYRGHADVSAHYLVNYLMLTENIFYELPIEVIDSVEAVHQHMNMHGKLGKKNITNNRLTDRVIKLTYEFSKIDSKSKITEETLDMD